MRGVVVVVVSGVVVELVVDFFWVLVVFLFFWGFGVSVLSVLSVLSVAVVGVLVGGVWLTTGLIWMEGLVVDLVDLVQGREFFMAGAGWGGVGIRMMGGEVEKSGRDCGYCELEGPS
jgi:hypothetical protein